MILYARIQDGSIIMLMASEFEDSEPIDSVTNEAYKTFWGVLPSWVQSGWPEPGVPDNAGDPQLTTAIDTKVLAQGDDAAPVA